MTYAEIFSDIKGKFLQADISQIKEHLAYQFNIEGEGEGIFYVEAKEGKLSVEPYEYYDRDVMFSAEAEVFLAIAEGKLDSVEAVTTGKLKVEGDIDKAWKLQSLINSGK